MQASFIVKDSQNRSVWYTQKSAWLHGTFQDAAYIYTHKMYKQFVTDGGLDQ